MMKNIIRISVKLSRENVIVNSSVPIFFHRDEPNVGGGGRAE